MRIIAHRGYSEKYPENTIIAFEQAIIAGATAIECDVQEFGGEFFIFHDWSLDRLTNMHGPVSQLREEQLADIRVHNTHKIPTVKDLFSAVQDNILLNLELKSVNDPLAFVNLINLLLNQSDTDVVLSSFNHPMLTNIRSLLRGSRHQNRIKYAGLISHLPMTKAQYALESEFDIAAIEAHLVNEEFVKHAHQHNIDVWSYTVNDETLLQKLQCTGVDAIFSDRVSWALEVVSK